MWQEPAFDHHAFDNRRPHAVSAESCIAFSDYERLHVITRKLQQERRLPTPEWALNDKLCREVVLKYLERRNYLSRGNGTVADRLARVDAEAKRRAVGQRRKLDELFDQLDRATKLGAAEHELRSLRSEIQNLDSQIVLAGKGLAATVTAVVYCYYRLGYNSVEVAKETGLKPPAVRILLWRLHRVVDKSSRRQYHEWEDVKLAALEFMVRRGDSNRTIAAAFRISEANVNNVIRLYAPELRGLRRRGNKPNRKRTVKKRVHKRRVRVGRPKTRQARPGRCRA